MADSQLDPSELRQLIQLVEVEGLAELEVESEGVRVALRRHVPTASTPAPQPPATETELIWEVETPTAAPAPQTQLGPIDDPRYAKVLSPMTGTFYRAASPEDPPFVEVGDVVERHQPIGLIEAMKVFSEIPAETAGRVVALPVRNGEMVLQGQVLAVLDPLEPLEGDSALS